MKYRVTEKWTNDTFYWTEEQLLLEVNRDRSEEWTDYTLSDLRSIPREVIEWLEGDYIVEAV